jgi:hypothetical protein
VLWCEGGAVTGHFVVGEGRLSVVGEGKSASMRHRQDDIIVISPSEMKGYHITRTASKKQAFYIIGNERCSVN